MNHNLMPMTTLPIDMSYVQKAQKAMGPNSITHLGGLSGADMNDLYPGELYGAEFKDVSDNTHTPYFEFTVVETIKRPWRAEWQERTFLNNTKRLNEPPVKTYRELRFNPISGQKYETYEPIIYKPLPDIPIKPIPVTEPFNNNKNNNNNYNIIVKENKTIGFVVIVVLVLIILAYLSK